MNLMADRARLLTLHNEKLMTTLTSMLWRSLQAHLSTEKTTIANKAELPHGILPIEEIT